ncbi:MAG TPA: hypothetical protein VJJ81_02580 [Candidatus Babeliales bacterium]|nr:hypothetical protein [Candidatus Babeliales bacterium]
MIKFIQHSSNKYFSSASTVNYRSFFAKASIYYKSKSNVVFLVRQGLPSLALVGVQFNNFTSLGLLF